MKKISLVITVLCLILSACVNKAAFNKSQFLEDIQPNIECLNSATEEIFLADVDFNYVWNALYESEEEYNDGLGEPILLYKKGEAVEGYYEDPSDTDYYLVTNFTTNSQVRENMLQFLSENVTDEVFDNDFFEYEGKLYLKRGGRGYGALTYNLETLKYKEEKDGKHYAEIDVLLFDEYERTDVLTIEKIDDRWIISAVSQDK